MLKPSEIVQALEALKVNPSYALVKKSLSEIRDTIDWVIFDTKTSDEVRREMVIRRKDITLFIELPDDLINEYSVLNDEE